jgi:hypothetical protein
MPTIGDVFGNYGEVNGASTERAVMTSIAKSGLNPEQVTERIEWAVREAYIRGTGDGYAKGVKEFALIWPIK